MIFAYISLAIFPPLSQSRTCQQLSPPSRRPSRRRTNDTVLFLHLLQLPPGMTCYCGPSFRPQDFRRLHEDECDSTMWYKDLRQKLLRDARQAELIQHSNLHPTTIRASATDSVSVVGAKRCEEEPCGGPISIAVYEVVGAENT